MKKEFVIFVILGSILLMMCCSKGGDIDDALNKAKKEGKAVILELGSVGCIPCDNMKPVMDKLSQNYKGRLEVIFIDVRYNKEATRQFRVHMIPTQVFLDKNGQEFHRHIGYYAYYAYENIVPVLKMAGL